MGKETLHNSHLVSVAVDVLERMPEEPLDASSCKSQRPWLLGRWQ